MKHEKKFSQEQQVSETQSRQTTEHEFASVEELLRFDAKQTSVPPAIAERLGRSLQNESCPPRSWWRRWLGRQ
ncbi:MAG TPA: hypothetical protein VGH42_10445 [Verrucomicrobiae bacterium]|jgi:hypothetical protein